MDSSYLEVLRTAALLKRDTCAFESLDGGRRWYL